MFYDRGGMNLELVASGRATSEEYSKISNHQCRLLSGLKHGEWDFSDPIFHRRSQSIRKLKIGDAGRLAYNCNAGIAKATLQNLDAVFFTEEMDSVFAFVH